MILERQRKWARLGVFGIVREAFSKKACPGRNLTIEEIEVARAGRRAFHTEVPACERPGGRERF